MMVNRLLSTLVLGSAATLVGVQSAAAQYGGCYYDPVAFAYICADGEVFPTSDLDPLFQNSLGTTLQAFENGTEQLDDGQNYNMQRRIASLRGAGLASREILGSQYASVDGQLAQDSQGPVDNTIDQFGFFTNLSGGSLTQTGNDNVQGTLGLSESSSGTIWTLTIGGDYRIPFTTTTDQGDEVTNDLIAVGLAFGVGQVALERTNILDSKTTNFDFMGYALITPYETLYIDILAGYGVSTIDYRRGTAAGFVGNSDVSGDKIMASASVGYDYDLYEGLIFSPFVGLDYSQSDYDGFGESGFGTNGQSRRYSDFEVTSLTGTIGAQVGHAFSFDQGIIQPFARAQYVREFADDDSITTSDAAGASTQQRTTTLDRNYAIFAAGVVAVLVDDWSVNAQGEFMTLNNNQERLQLTLGVAKRF